MTKSAPAVNARIVYWGASQAGVSTTLQRISTKLRPDHRGELQEIPTRLDPTVSYEVLPIKLGDVGGIDTRIEIVAVPGAAEHAPTRKQLLDRADGVVFVVDARRERIAENVERFDELRRTLAAYGRSIEAVPLVIQINKRDLADPAGIEELVRKLDLPQAPLFETVATDGSGVLQVLSTISKGVVRSLRNAPGRARGAARPEAPRPAPAPLAVAVEEWPAPLRARRVPEPPAPSSFEDVTGRLDPSPPMPAIGRATPPVAALRVVSVGSASCQDERNVVLPLELQDADGRRFRLTVTLAVGDFIPARR